MQALAWIIRIFVVLVLVWFASKNSEVVTLYGLPGQTWQASIVAVALVAFVTGVVIGLLAWIPTFVRQRREMGRLRKRVKNAPAAPVAPVPPAVPEIAPPPTDSHGV
jgi:putative membrane protein